MAVSAELRAIDNTSLSAPSGLAISDDELWVVDRSRGRLFRYSLSDAFVFVARLPALEEVALDPANARAGGLAMDAAWLYVVDESDKQVYRYARLGTGAVEASHVMAETSGGSLRAPSGVTVTDSSLFVADRSRDRVYEYDLKELFDTGVPESAEEKDYGPVPATDDYGLKKDNADARGLHNVLENATPQVDPKETGHVKGITDLHNIVRTKTPNANHNPPPDPALKPFAWDTTLADAAQKHADDCSGEHAKGVAESLFPAPNDKRATAAREAVGEWAKEGLSYTYASDTCAVKDCGHYKQIVSDKTERVGCGIAYCTDPAKLREFTFMSSTDGGKTWKTEKKKVPWTFVVCRYDPSRGDAQPYAIKK